MNVSSLGNQAFADIIKLIRSDWIVIGHNPVVGVFLRRSRGESETRGEDTQKTLREDRDTDQSYGVTSQGKPSIAGSHQELQKAETDSPLQPSDTVRCPADALIFDFWLPQL